jgi:hypothetical protein
MRADSPRAPTLAIAQRGTMKVNSGGCGLVKGGAVLVRQKMLFSTAIVDF